MLNQSAFNEAVGERTTLEGKQTLYYGEFKVSTIKDSYLMKYQNLDTNDTMNAYTALALRIGIGLVFVFGGWNKLSKLIDPATQSALVDSYMGTAGYINTFFANYLFSTESLLTPWSFLTLLSAFELLSGLMLLAGLLVRPLALIYAFLVWTFVMALPVVTTPGVDPASKTYLAPAILVQIRDITLSGLLFALFNLGSGAYSLDERIFGKNVHNAQAKWEHIGLLIRLSLAVMLLVGGFFAGMANIKSFGIPGLILIIVGFAMLVEKNSARVAGFALVAMMLFYMGSKLTLDKTLVGNLNAIKREFAFLAGGLVLGLRGGENLYTAVSLMQRINTSFNLAFNNLQKRRA